MLMMEIDSKNPEKWMIWLLVNNHIIILQIFRNSGKTGIEHRLHSNFKGIIMQIISKISGIIIEEIQMEAMMVDLVKILDVFGNHMRMDVGIINNLMNMDVQVKMEVLDTRRGIMSSIDSEVQRRGQGIVTCFQ
jgi:hypothetical protein